MNCYGSSNSFQQKIFCSNLEEDDILCWDDGVLLPHVGLIFCDFLLNFGKQIVEAPFLGSAHSEGHLRLV